MHCLLCDKRIGKDNLAELFFSEDLLCTACRNQWERIDKTFMFHGKKAHVLWNYNEAFATALLQYKERKDEALRDIFFCLDAKRLHRKYRKYTLVPMPSSQKKLEERGFSHLEGMYGGLHLPYVELFDLKEEMDQKGKGIQERKQMIHNLFLKPDVQIPENILLVDDTITTGSTLLGALEALKMVKNNVQILSCGMSKKG